MARILDVAEQLAHVHRDPELRASDALDGIDGRLTKPDGPPGRCHIPLHGSISRSDSSTPRSGVAITTSTVKRGTRLKIQSNSSLGSGPLISAGDPRRKVARNLIEVTEHRRADRATRGKPWLRVPRGK